MSLSSLAALTRAIANSTLDEWLAALPSDVARNRVRWALEIDHRITREHPAALPSCLLARLVGDPALETTCAAWQRELDESGAPWIRPLRTALSRSDGLLAELHASTDLDLHELAKLQFETDDVVTLVPRRFHASVQPPEARRRDRLHWAWTRGEARVEPDPRADQPLRRDLYPRFVSDGWGPVYLQRSPDGERVALPCPEEGSASGHMSSDGSRMFVYGTLDEYAGGFAWILDPTTLAIQRRLATARPVSEVHECEQPDLFLVETYGGLIVWEGDASRPLSVRATSASLSPSGRYVATMGDGLRIWSITASTVPREGGLGICFDPSGARLLSGKTITDAHTGAAIARLDVELGGYLEGGPARPWLHFGERWLSCTFNQLCAWDSRTGEPASVEEPLHFPHWYTLAYDRAGERLAVMRRSGTEVVLHELPTGRKLGEFSLGEDSSRDSVALVLSADASLIAVRRGLDVEVWRTTGSVLRRFRHQRADSDNRTFPDPSTLRFDEAGQHVASFVAEEGWRIWALAGDGVQTLADFDSIQEVAAFAEPRPGDWLIEAKSATTFVHRPTGVTIVLPAAGPWVFNPSKPEIAACPDLHVELRGGTRDS